MDSLFQQFTNLSETQRPFETHYLSAQMVNSAPDTAELIIQNGRDGQSQNVKIAVHSKKVRAACSCDNKSAACAHIFRALDFLDWGRFPWPDGKLTFQRDNLSPWKLALITVEADRQRRQTIHNPISGGVRCSYVIDLEDSVANGEVTLYVATSHFRRGVWSRPDYEGPSPLEMDLDLADQKAVDVLDRLSERPEFERDFVVPQVALPLVLKTLSKTSRLFWTMSVSFGPDRWNELSWSDRVWRPRIHVSGNSVRWTLRGTFQQKSTVRPVSEAVLVLSDGVVLFPDQAATYANPSSVYSWILALRSHGDIKVPRRDTPELLEKLTANLDTLDVIEFPEELQYQQVKGVPTPRLRIGRPLKGTKKLPVDVDFLYAGQAATSSFGTVDHDQRLFVERDRKAEEAHLAELEGVNVSERVSSADEPGVYELAAEHLPSAVAELTAADWIIEADGKLLRKSSLIHIKVKSGVDWFDLDGKFDFDGQTVSFPKVLSAMRRGDSFVTLDDGSQGLLPEDWLEKFADVAHLGEADGDALRFSMPQAALLDALLDAQDNVELDAKYRRYREKLREFSGVEPIEPHQRFQGELRSYQKEGLGWLEFLREFHLGGCLADDMGLGKTIQVLATLQLERNKRATKKNPRRPSLIVVPRSLLFNWAAEAKRFTPELKVMQYFGQTRKQLREQWDEHDIIVTTYGIVRRDIELLMEQQFHYLVLDEAQAIKNNSSQAAKACRLLNARHRLALTGTPVENHLGELWSLFEFLNPGLLGRNDAFMTLARRASEDQKAASMIAHGIRPFVLRRTKQEVLTDLPEKTEQTIICDMDRKQRESYDELRTYYRKLLSEKVDEQGLNRSKIHVLEALLRLRQCACDPKLLDPKSEIPSAKLNALFDNLDNIIADGHKALIFSQFTKLLGVVRQELDERGIRYEYLDGRTRRREDRVQAFQENPECPLFLISLKAGGHGLNLTAADYVFILDPWWNPAVEAQAVDRAHRIGQDKPVFAYRLICRDTVEEKIVQLQSKKRDLADAIINADNSLMRDLTAEDLAVLLS